MKKLYLFLIIILIFTFSCQTAFADVETDFTTIDAHALAAPRSATRSMEALAQYLIEPAETDLEKTRAIFRWITENIEYDVGAFFSGRPSSGSPQDTLRSGRSVCSGYSGLFTELATLAGLEVVSVNGYAKGYGYNQGDTFSSTNHAWNAVRIDGEWYLLDSTWGAGHVNGRRFVRRYNEFYFLTPPEEFIFTHLPTDPQWQLLDDPLTLNEFENQVYVRPEIFVYGFSAEEVREAASDPGSGSVVRTSDIFGTPVEIRHAPITGNLETGEEYFFEMYMPDSEGAAVINGGEWVFLEEKDGVYSGVITANRGDIKLTSRLPGRGNNYYTILWYQGQ
ncbi:MAG: transglutaminase domain-containing protein [Spirochaetia bacterium]